MEFHFQPQSSSLHHHHHLSKAINPPKFKGKPKTNPTATARSTKFVGVRQRPSGRWVAEIKDTTQKIRMWLGTFETAEEAARAYDEAARLLRGSNTRTNFASHPVSTANSPLALRIRNLLSSRDNPPQRSISCQPPPRSSGATFAEERVHQAIESSFAGASGYVYKPQSVDVRGSTDEFQSSTSPADMPWVVEPGVDLAPCGASDQMGLPVENAAHHGYLEGLFQDDSLWDMGPFSHLFSCHTL